MALKHKKLIDQLTIEEKVSLLSGKDFWQTQDLKKIDLPSAFLSDGPTGLRKQAAAADNLGLNPSVPATCFPSSATTANTWNPELGYLMGQTIGEEAAAHQVSILLGPGVNMKRNPMCGRNFEYFSEDPYLAGKMGAAYIRGVQSNGISACVKHFAANNQETKRMASDSIIDERALREIYLTAFEMAIKEGGTKTVMSSYNKINGTYTNENDHLLLDILRKEWGFKGVVVTDWGGENDRVLGLKASNELEMPSTCGETNLDVLKAINEGTLDVKYVDQAIDRLIDLVLETAENLKGKSQEFDKEAHHNNALEVARESVVLLKNDEDILPLKPGSKVAVIGDFANTPRYQGAGSSIVNPLKIETINECVKEEQFGLEVVGYEPGFKRYGKKSESLKKKAKALAEKADYVLLFLGLDEFSETEGLDRKTISIPQNQLDLLQSLSDTAKPIICVISAGSPVELPFVENVKGLVHGYLGGEAGARAMLEVLTGKVNPSGKLSETLPVAYDDCSSADHFGKSDNEIEYRESIFIGYRYFLTASVPTRFPFGYGLSYTKFEYSDLKVDEKGITIKVKNIGKVAGKEAVQMYIGLKDSKVFRPTYELKGFSKVALEPGEEKEVAIAFDEYSFRYFNVKTNKWEVEEGDYDIYVGASSMDIRLTGKVHQEGTGAKAPYKKTELPAYYTGQVRHVHEDEFEKLLGRKIERTTIEPKGKRKKIRIEVKPETAICDMRYAKGWFGRFFNGALRFIIWLLPKFGQRATANTMTMGVYLTPLRNMSRASGGIICWGQLMGLITMFNGHFWKGLGEFRRAGKAFKKIRKEREVFLKAQEKTAE
ncbi:MAG: glycoside hydrolase family 3 C-terminal domain-containing protein [Bacilli bacterium]|nr:glycoside hydrolase family 3 C-terminal domain-containing protein [Bacilli bacterium]